MVILLGALCLVLAGAVLLLVRERAVLRARVEESGSHVEQLESDLDAALRPLPPANPAERAMRRMIRTASRVRSHGITGLIQSTVEDLQTWASSEDERADILNMAASDGTVTLVFSDIEGSTALNDRLGDATWVKVLAVHDRVLRSRIEQYRGQVVKTAGDGFMVAFRDAEAACRAALAIQRDLPRDITLRRHGIQVRMGVHTGQVVARDGDYFGRNVAMAARVADLAAGGEILASDALCEALDEDAALTLEELEPVALKGLPGEHVVWRIHPPNALSG